MRTELSLRSSKTLSRDDNFSLNGNMKLMKRGGGGGAIQFAIEIPTNFPSSLFSLLFHVEMPPSFSRRGYLYNYEDCREHDADNRDMRRRGECFQS